MRDFHSEKEMSTAVSHELVEDADYVGIIGVKGCLWSCMGNTTLFFLSFSDRILSLP